MQDGMKAIDAQWWALTNAGNDAFERHEHMAARRDYEGALVESGRLFEQARMQQSVCLYAPVTYNSRLITWPS